MPRAANKYGARKTERFGIVFASQAEADYAQQLEYQRIAGRIQAWRRAPTLPLVAGLKYTPDFEVVGEDGVRFLIEVKGVQSEAFRMRLRLFKHYYPNDRLVIVTRGVEREA